MATINLYDRRDPMVVGAEAFKALLDDNVGEILVDRDALSHAFYEAVAHLAKEWGTLASVLAELLQSDDVVVARDAIAARRNASEAQKHVHVLLGLIWDASSSMPRAEAGA
jgi:hypothetical protein